MKKSKNSLQPVIDLLQERFAQVDVHGSPTFALKSFVAQARAKYNSPSGLSIGDLADLANQTYQAGQWWTPNSGHQELEHIDNQILAWATEEGYLDASPVVRARTKTNLLGLPRIPAFYFPSLTPEKGEIMLASHENGVLDVNKDGKPLFEKTPLEERLFVLFHEAAHSVFEDIAAPFVLPENLYGNVFGPADAQMINQVYFTLRVGVPAITVFNEMFADTYGGMMLLKACDFSDQSQEFLRNTMVMRAEEQEKNEEERIIAGARSVKRFAPHNTATSLRDVLNNVEQLRHKTPQQLRAIACQIASVNWVKWLSPTRTIPTRGGERVPQDDLALQRLFGGSLADNALFVAAAQWMQGFDPQQHLFASAHKSLRTHLTTLWSHLAPEVEKVIAPTDRKKWEIGSLSKGLTARMWAFIKIYDVLKKMENSEQFTSDLAAFEKYLEKTNKTARKKLIEFHESFPKPSSSRFGKNK